MPVELYTFYITKHALTSGVEKKDLSLYISDSGDRYASGKHVLYFIGRDAFETIEDAIENVKLRKSREIKNVEKKLEKLKAFDVENHIKSL